MSEILVTYLHDHLAGSMFAVELLRMIQNKHTDHRFGAFASELLPEVEDDRTVLEAVADRIGHERMSVKDAAGWLAQKLTELKLNNESLFGTFEAFEALELGVTGKLLLWRMLKQVSDRFPLDGFDFDALVARAGNQRDRVEAHRIEAGLAAFSEFR